MTRHKTTRTLAWSILNRMYNRLFVTDRDAAEIVYEAKLRLFKAMTPTERSFVGR